MKDQIRKIQNALNKQENDFIPLLEKFLYENDYDSFQDNTRNTIILLLEQGIAQHPTNAYLYVRLFESLYNDGLSDQMQTIIGYRDKIPKNKEAALAWELLGKAYLHEMDYPNAYHTFRISEGFGQKPDDYIYDCLLDPSPLDQVEIENYYGIQNAKLEELEDKKEIYFLGENGVGKTILLQAILISLRQSNIPVEQKTDEGGRIIHFRQGLILNPKEQTSKLFQSEKISIAFEEVYPNAFAYGVGRLRTDSNKTDKTGYASLFDQENASLTNPEAFLKDVLILELQNKSKLKLTQTLQMLSDILNIEENSNIRIEQEKDKAGFVFIEHGEKLEFNQLADGYRSILIILADLLKRLSENQPDVTEIKKFKGIVLIDEVDMLLHPKWEYKIVRQLRKKLPNIQWFFSTHSPMLILGASDDAIFYRLYKEAGKTKISEAWTGNDLNHLMANGIITSPLFDMPTARMNSQTDLLKLDTTANFWLGKINAKIEAQVNVEKENGKVYFSKTDINELVEWAIDQIDKDVKND